MAKLLIVDDEKNIREIVRKYAVFEGFDCIEASNGMEAITVFEENDVDLIIMDAMMPELDGFSASSRIRQNSNVPIIMLSARGEEYDKIHGFELGVDDYVVKPFSPKELMMRVKAILGRAKQANEDKEFELGGLNINFVSRVVTVDGERVQLSPKEYDLLFYMVRNADVALSREKLINEIWGYDFYGDERTLDTHIKLIRKRLGPYAKLIVTLRGVGYRFETQEIK